MVDGYPNNRGQLSEPWCRLDGHNQLPKIIEGVKFIDGLEVAANPTNSQPQTVFHRH